MQYTAAVWDAAAAHFAAAHPAYLDVIYGMDANTLLADAQPAMQERGYAVSVGVSVDAEADGVVLRLET